MKTIDAEQGSPEWHAARAGRATASRMGDIMRQTKNGRSAMRATYAGELVAERLSGVVDLSTFTSAAMQRGIETEDKARAYYGFIHDVEPQRVGFVLHPTIEWSGASPDRLVGNDGLIEIKCPNTATHIRTLLGDDPIDPDYVKQMQWQMACTGRQWCDFVSYDDRMPPDMAMHVSRVPRDPLMIALMESNVLIFLEDVQAMIDALMSKFRGGTLLAAE